MRLRMANEDEVWPDLVRSYKCLFSLDSLAAAAIEFGMTVSEPLFPARFRDEECELFSIRLILP